ncbi:MAG: 23S rRNA (adenine(2503)-C(2))-methyltransferase RlmN [Candidatus Omnitrophica bacterium]|nr:23S rRNA (adenine(2503)-C(2))-methyltransferase RlmN [Candidatus Omnitrophota bacterium]MCM8816352.1 23S rRNA (adenine(2503)-C(2))-methyltransferase RlmN [Candidatus Omnitrophota bacterium]
MINIRNFDLIDLKKILFSMKEPPYRAIQIFNWLYKKGIEDISLMSDISKHLRDFLASQYSAKLPELFNVKISRDTTRKFVFRLSDNRFIETVLIPEQKRNTLCISTQVGCKYNCRFCASGKMGFVRNLETWEIIGQVLYILFKEKINITNIVYMGMGEPFDNYDAVIRSIRIINDRNGINIGARRITVSTAGVVPEIIKFTNLKWQVRLSVSLHSAIEETRSFLMPINKKYPLSEVIKACHFYVQNTKRKITFEYILIEGINDTKKHVLALADVASLLGASVNIIPFSRIKECEFSKPSDEKIVWFSRCLKEKGIRTTVRRSRGLDIDAACGQLAGTLN